ncbi:hypothetical protein PG984_003446 [Apiospora sp. TS-2023a]
MSGSSSPVVQPLAGFEDLATETQIAILSQTDLITPYKRVHWDVTGFYLCVPDNVQHQGRLNLQAYFLASRAVRQIAIQVFYSNNEFVVEEAAPNPPRYVLSVGININDPDWRRVAGDVAPSMESLRTLTVVAKYDMDNTIYDFGALNTLIQLRHLVDQKIWPLHPVGEKFQQLVVHFHSGAGSWLAGRDPRFEPTYFLERKDLPKESSC